MNICSKFCECHLPPGLQTIILWLFHNFPSFLFNEIGDYVNSKEYREPEWIQKMKEIQERLDSKWHIFYWPWFQNDQILAFFSFQNKHVQPNLLKRLKTVVFLKDKRLSLKVFTPVIHLRKSLGNSMEYWLKMIRIFKSKWKTIEPLSLSWRARHLTMDTTLVE